ncbi:MAG: nucleotide sugar dehydrogenase [Nitrospirae bacterium]|nr:nucleotide sugar dehydrogenase [Nitrospirota bacterium]
MTTDRDRICVLGMGFIGLTLATTISEAGFDVLGVDVSQNVIDSLRRKECYFFEPGLNELVERFGGKNLQFSTGIPDRSCNYYIICVGTPVDQETKRPRLDYIRNATHSILPYLKKGDTVILRSTVPMGVSRNFVLKIIEGETDLKAGRDFYFGFVPERTVEGNALYEQKHIPQIIGALDDASAERIETIFGKFNDKRIRVPDIEHAEICKIIDNTYRDVTFAYANQMAMICEELGLDFHAVRQACNNDYARNKIPAPSPGVGGACLTKDPYILIDLCRKLNINTELINAARGINEAIVFNLGKKILNRLTALGRNIYSSKIFIMGFAFKGEPETSDCRFSTTIDLINYLKPFCSELFGYDAVVSKPEIESYGVIYSSVEDGFEGADVVVIMNSHKSHSKLDIKGLAGRSNNPLIFIDCWKLYDKKEIQSYGNIIYSSVGLY